MNVRLIGSLVFLITLMAVSGCQSTGDGAALFSTGEVTQAATLASACSGCHAPGSQASAIVRLDEYDAGQLTTLFNRYRQDESGETAMHRMARGYTDEEVALIADFLAGER